MWIAVIVSAASLALLWGISRQADRASGVRSSLNLVIASGVIVLILMLGTVAGRRIVDCGADPRCDSGEHGR